MEIKYNKLSILENTEKPESKISYSEYSTWVSCPRKWKLKYLDKNRLDDKNINLIFGSAFHSTLQEYLYVAYTNSDSEAKKLNLEKILLDNLKEEYLNSKGDGEDFCTSDELNIAYQQGIEMINWFVKHRSDFYNIKNMELIGIEVPINVNLFDEYNVNIIGYIDVLMYDKVRDKYIVIDIKTSRTGWRQNDKKNKTKINQLILYKMYLSKQYKIPIEKIEVIYHIYKKIVPEDPEYAVMKRRVQTFSPSEGSVTMNRTKKEIKEFIELNYNKDGSYIVKENYRSIKGKSGGNCTYCPYKNMHDLCNPKERNFI